MHLVTLNMLGVFFFCRWPLSVEELSFSSCFVECFYHKSVLDFSSAFPAFIEIIMWFLSLILLIWHIILIYFMY